MPKFIFRKARSVEPSTAPADFANASPFRHQTQQVFIGLAIVLLVFLGSMVAVLMMHAPSL